MWFLAFIVITFGNDIINGRINATTLSPTMNPTLFVSGNPTPSPTTLPTNIIDSWTKYDSNELQRYYQFSGFDHINNKIYLIGGILPINKYDTEIPIISYDIKNGNITNVTKLASLGSSDTTEISRHHKDWEGQRAVDEPQKFPIFYSITQGYAVLNNVIYMLLSGSGLIYSFNMTDLKTTLHDENEALYLNDSMAYSLNGTGLAMASICSDNKRFIAIIGGVQIAANNSLLLDGKNDTRNRAVIFDFILDEWIILQNLVKPRIGHACWVFDNKYIYVFGGSTDIPTINDPWFTTSVTIDATTRIEEIIPDTNDVGDQTIEKLVYNDDLTNIDLQNWNVIPNQMCVGRRGHRVTQILNDNKIYIIGGHYGGRVVEVLLPEQNDLLLTSSAFHAKQRVSHTVVSSHDQIYIFSGFAKNNAFERSYEVSNNYTESKESGFVSQSQCFPSCSIDTSSSGLDINSVIGSYNSDSNIVTLIHKYSQDVWMFDPESLKYIPITPRNTINDITTANITLHTIIPPLYVAINNIIYIWAAFFDQGIGMIGYNVTSNSYFDPQLAGPMEYFPVFNDDRTKCLVTDGQCILMIFQDNPLNPRVMFVNICQPPSFWQINADVPVLNSLNRIEFSCEIMNNRLYFIGGAGPQTNSFNSQNIEIRFIDITTIQDCVYNLNCPVFTIQRALTIETLSDNYNLAHPRFSPQTIPLTTPFKNSILVVGGYSIQGLIANTEIIDFNLGQTYSIPSFDLVLPHKSQSFYAVAEHESNPELFIFGGVSFQTGAIKQCTTEHTIGLHDVVGAPPSNQPSISPTKKPTQDLNEQSDPFLPSDPEFPPNKIPPPCQNNECDCPIPCPSLTTSNVQLIVDIDETVSTVYFEAIKTLIHRLIVFDISIQSRISTITYGSNTDIVNIYSFDELQLPRNNILSLISQITIPTGSAITPYLLTSGYNNYIDSRTGEFYSSFFLFNQGSNNIMLLITNDNSNHKPCIQNMINPKYPTLQQLYSSNIRVILVGVGINTNNDNWSSDYTCILKNGLNDVYTIPINDITSVAKQIRNITCQQNAISNEVLSSKNTGLNAIYNELHTKLGINNYNIYSTSLILLISLLFNIIICISCLLMCMHKCLCKSMKKHQSKYTQISGNETTINIDNQHNI